LKRRSYLHGGCSHDSAQKEWDLAVGKRGKPMAEKAAPLSEGEHGRHAELAGRPLPAGLVFQFIPSLAAMLTRAEELADRPLTRDEVVRIRDNCHVIVTRPELARSADQRRGYTDLDPADPWTGWKKFRPRI
jgi:hypothetical protein